MNAMTQFEPSPKWLKLGGLRFGSQAFNFTCSFIYFAVAFLPLVLFLLSGKQGILWAINKPLLAFAWATFVAMAYPIWSWKEVIAFESWVRTIPDAEQRRVERTAFSVHSSAAKSFWAAVLAIYAAVGIFGNLARLSV